MQATLFKAETALDPLEAELKHHVEVHKYYINRYVPYELSMEEAFESWGRLVYGPITSAIDKERLDAKFPAIGEDELFLRVCRLWHEMKKGGKVSVAPREAVLEFAARSASTES